MNGAIVSNDRDLYDFFDEQKLFVGITPFYNYKKKLCFEIAIVDKNGSGDYEGKYDTVRFEAEETAFEKAFETLESKLKGE